MESAEYWESRALANEAYADKVAKQTINRKIYRYYSKSQKDLDARIMRVFKKYAHDNVFTDAQAKEKLSLRESQKELNALRKELSEIKDPEIKKEALARLNVGAYRARITRLEAIKANIEAQQAILADREKRTIKSVLKDVCKNSYYHHIFDVQKGTGFGFSFSMLNDKAIDKIIHEKWSGDDFSRRIWLNSQKTAFKAYNVITRGIITGETIPNMTKQLNDELIGSEYMSMRLIRTECNRVHNAANLKAYEEEGVEKYRFLATLDKVTCDKCAKLDGKIFNVKDARQGKNLPPLHPNDRCTTVSELPKELLEKLKRRARDPDTGKVSEIPANTTYKEWYERAIKNSEE